MLAVNLTEIVNFQSNFANLKMSECNTDLAYMHGQIITLAWLKLQI